MAQQDFVLLDRSGSMGSGGLWTEALASINSYVKKLAEDRVDTGVTLATFDKDGGVFKFEILRDRITPAVWQPVTNAEAQPRGMTPLNDAIGRIVAMANAGPPVNPAPFPEGKFPQLDIPGYEAPSTTYDKVAIIVMTDGLENASTSVSGTAAKKLLDDCRTKDWQVIFLGANFDNAAQAQQYGNLAGATVSASAGMMEAAFTSTATKRGLYGSGASGSMSFSEKEKKEFSKPDARKRTAQ